MRNSKYSSSNLNNNNEVSRLQYLDYLRGLAAFGIMIYHYTGWLFGHYGADSFMGRVGIYGVSVFYVLSGLTLYHVYFHKMQPSINDIFLFIKKRVFRIFPLLWLTTITAIFLLNKFPGWLDVFLNLTGLFGFFKWDTYFSAGVWSIGNELVFYVFFPIFVLFSKKHKILMGVLVSLLFFVYLYFSFMVLSPELPLAKQSRNYSNPLNQIFLFLGGFLIGILFNKVNIKNITLVLFLIFGSILFVYYPVEGNSVMLVTGVNRLVLTSACFVICICFYKLSFICPLFIDKPFSLLGELSYSVYLLHPIVFKIIGRTIHINSYLMVILSVLITIMISWFSYNYFEKFFMGLAKKKKEIKL